jgi:arsenate reductase
VEEHLSSFLVARSGGGVLVGCVGLERHGELGLLRSAAVLPQYQGQWIGVKLIREMLKRGADEGATEVALLTTTAKDYFKNKFGFEEAKRSRYEKRLQNSPEWNLPRCSSASFMTLKLKMRTPINKKRVLILCTGNSARSQMAEGILRHDGGDAFEVESAGLKPSVVRPEAIRVMQEIGIDISGHRSKSVDEFAGQEFDYVITVCDNAKETCPIFPGRTTRIHHSVEDPPPPGAKSDEETLSIFRRVRHEIREWMKRFIADEQACT